MASILVVDDEYFIHEVYQQLLSTAGVHTVTANAFDGAEAFEIYRNMDPPADVIIMDHRMPVFDGITATERILEYDPAARILFVSADSSVKVRAMEAGALGFLSKPFRSRELLEEIERMLGENSTGHQHS